ncbi:c-type cytochrome domain-containing protein [Aquirufa aurantiipilula]
MNKEQLSSWYSVLLSSLIFLHALLLFLLFWQDQVNLPWAFQLLGRFHPLILHIPIGLGILLPFVHLLRRPLGEHAFYLSFRFVLYLTAFFAAITALFGFFLSQESGFEPELLVFHQWSGLAVAWIYLVFLLLFDRLLVNPSQAFIGSLLGVVILAAAGHGGANITHGENYLLELWRPEKEIKAPTGESALFEGAIQPILKKKCVSCHNDQKTKGQLNMSSVAKVLEGGKHGDLWKAGDVSQSLFLKRAHLPMEHKEHMPPKGKSQLTPDEILLLEAWVKDGAFMDKKIKAYAPALQVSQLVARLFATPASIEIPKREYPFSAASESDLEEVNSPFCSVYPLSSDAPALQADFYVAKRFELKTLENLSKVAEQVVGINLAKMPIKDENLNILSQFINLEKLNLNFTEIQGANLKALLANKKLLSLSLSGTKITASQLQALISQLPQLKEVFIWNTNIPLEQIASWKNTYPKIRWEQGFVPSEEKLMINPPILVNENFFLGPQEKVIYKHTIQGTSIHYTLEKDQEPDSLGTLITTGPIDIPFFTVVKALATKPGWLASKVVKNTFYKYRFVPDSVYLMTKPELKWQAKGGSTLKDLVQGKRDTRGLANDTWIGFQQQDADALFEFKQAKNMKGITVSYLRKQDSNIFPPLEIEIWGGNSATSLKKLASVKPEQPEENGGYSPQAINIPLPSGTYTHYRMLAKRIKRFPAYVKDKANPAIIKLDEVLFY